MITLSHARNFQRGGPREVLYVKYTMVGVFYRVILYFIAMHSIGQISPTNFINIKLCVKMPLKGHNEFASNTHKASGFWYVSGKLFKSSKCSIHRHTKITNFMVPLLDPRSSHTQFTCFKRGPNPTRDQRSVRSRIEGIIYHVNLSHYGQV